MTLHRLWLLAVLVVLSGCVPLFLPPVPNDTLVPQAVWRLAGDGEVRWTGLQLELRLSFSEVPEAAWVAVQWFGESNGERASLSYWIEPSDVERVFVWPLPSDVTPVPGAWRAVVSVGSTLLRQFSGNVW
jgi:hypothetical protein